MQKVLDLWELFHCREILPWQIKSTFIIVLFLLDLSRNALFYKKLQNSWPSPVSDNTTLNGACNLLPNQ